jgi:predicted NBD/HSP70 family sugar kinase
MMNEQTADGFIWGIDLGGTKIEGIILSSHPDPRTILRSRIDTEAGKGYDHILHRIATLVGKMKRESGIIPLRIGIGTPGILDPVDQVMKNCNSTALNGRPLKKDLESLLEVPVILANDANCFALAETRWGVVREQLPGARIVFGIIMGTGVGGGIVVNEKIWPGLHGIAGEWGHNFLDNSGGACYCGKQGCVETVISGPALEKYYAGITGHPCTLQEINALASEADPAALQTIDRLCNFFAKAVSVVVNILDPDAIVVGGGVGNIGSIYSLGVAKLQEYIFNNRSEVPILRPILGDSAGVFGAAALVSS